MHIDNAKKIYIYTKLMWIFQMLDLHQLTQNFWKQCAPNFIYVNLLQYKLYWFKAAWKSP